MVSMTSFEIIPSPEENTEQQEMPSPEMLLLTNPSSSSGAAASSSSNSQQNLQTLLSSLFDSRADEMQQKMNFLIQENNTLKDKVKKSNTVMLDQLNTIQCSVKAITEYKKKQEDLLQEKDKIIEELRKDNEELKNDNEELKAEVKEIDEEMIEDNKQLNMKIKELEALVKSNSASLAVLDEVTRQKDQAYELLELKLKTQTKELGEVIENLTDQLDEFQRTNKALQEESEELRAFNACLVTEIEQTKSPIEKEKMFASVFNDEESGYAIVFKEDDKPVQSDENAMHALHNLQLKYSELYERLQQEKLQNEKLVLQLELKNKGINSLTEDQNKKQNERAGAPSDCENLAYALWAKSDLVDVYLENNKELEKELKETKAKLKTVHSQDPSVMDQLKAELVALKESLQQQEHANELQKKSLIDTEVKLQQMTEMHDRAVQLLNAQEESQIMKSEQFSTMKDISERQHVEQLDILTAKLFNAEQLLEAEQEKTTQLVAELDLIKKNSSEMSAAEVPEKQCKMDYTKEKNGLKKVRSEVDRFTKVLGEGQGKIRDGEEVRSRKTHKHDSGHHHHHHHDRKGRRGKRSSDLIGKNSEEEEKDSASKNEKRFPCVHCKMTMATLEDLERHVELCMNDDIFMV